MGIFDRLRRTPRVHNTQVAIAVHPEEADPLMDKLVQACGYDLPGFTVVRPEAEIAWVVETVENHINGLDEWVSDAFDHEIEERHRIRLARIAAQLEARDQDATRSRAETEAVVIAVALKVAALRQRDRELRAELRGWTNVLTGQASDLQTTFVDDAEPPVLGRPVTVALPEPLQFGTPAEATEAGPRPTPTVIPDQRGDLAA